MPIIEEIPPWRPCSGAKCWFKLVVLGGLVSGLSFILFEIAACWISSGRPFVPLRLFAAPFLGMEAVAGSYPRINAVPVGMAALAAFSIFFSYILAALLTQFPKLAASSASLIATACVFAYLLWVIDFILIDQAAMAYGIRLGLHPGFQGFIGHVFFYGMALGFYMDRKQEKRARITNVRFRL